MKYFFYLILLCTIVPVPAQHRDTYFYLENDVTHKLFFYEDGQFAEFIISYNVDTLLSCALGTNISHGQYYRTHRGYSLTSSKDIQEKNDNLRYTLLPCKPLSKDSLFIFLSSPFEDLLLSEQHDFCAYKHQRIYRYCYQIICDESLTGQIFEKEFNERYQSLDTNIILCVKPKDVQLKSLFIKIFWVNPYDQVYKTKDTVYVNIYELEKNTNNLYIRLESFDYFYLSNEKYNQTYFPFIGKNKAMLNGMVFKRYKIRTRNRHLAMKRLMRIY